MACNDSDLTAKQLKNVTSISAGGESVTIEPGGMKADERADMNSKLVNIVNRRVRPYFLGCRIGRQPGW